MLPGNERRPMHLSDILTADRIYLDSEHRIRTKSTALNMLAELIAPSLRSDGETIEALLSEREKLQSTGIGDGVAIPHSSLQAVPCRVAGLLLCPDGIPFDSIDGAPVSIILGVVGPKEASSEHLRVLARISRLLRDGSTRERLVSSTSAEAAYELIDGKDRELG
jgi:PTS system nitrogen regulatory IIA component